MVIYCPLFVITRRQHISNSQKLNCQNWQFVIVNFLHLWLKNKMDIKQYRSLFLYCSSTNNYVVCRSPSNVIISIVHICATCHLHVYTIFEALKHPRLCYRVSLWFEISVCFLIDLSGFEFWIKFLEFCVIH